MNTNNNKLNILR